MTSRRAKGIVAVRVAGVLVAVGVVGAWPAAQCPAVGFHGGGSFGGGHAMGYSGGHAMGYGGGHTGFGGASPGIGGFSGARPASMPTLRPSGGSIGGFEHGAVPSFSHLTPSYSRPSQFSARPGGGATPSQLGSFLGLPGGVARPGQFGGGTNREPGIAWAAGHAGNRPGWAGSSAAPTTDVAARLRNAVKPDGSHARFPDPQRSQSWKEQGDQIRKRWEHGGRLPGDHGTIPGSDWWSKYHPNLKDHPPFDHGKIPGSDWWSKYHPNLDNWYYHHDWHHHGWAYWWRTPTWISVNTWFPAWGWTQPVIYDYGGGGNVVYENNSVYVNGQEVGSAADYARSAGELATVDPQQSQATPADNDWMPLGTFTVVTSEKDTNPSRVLQLAVDRQGIVSGSMHNSSTNQTYVVQGRVDKATQRVAFTIGDKSDIVMETGIYNLTQQQAPVLVHFGTDRKEQYLLVRLDPPAEADGSKGGAEPSSQEKPFGT